MRFAENVTKAGGEVALQIWPDMWHVFQFFIGQMPESGRAIDDIARFLKTEFKREATVDEKREQPEPYIEVSL